MIPVYWDVPVARGRDVFHPGFIWSWYTGMSRVHRDVYITLFHSKKRGKVDNNLSIKRKLILFA